MLNLKIQTDFGRLNNWVRALSEKDLPYITARSLTDLAGKVQSAHIQELSRTFILRNKYVVRSFRKTMAKKTDWPNCKAEEGSTAPFMLLHALGGTKSNKSGIRLGVPIGARPEKSSIIPKPLWLRELLNKKGYLNVTGSSSGREVILKQTRSAKTRRKKSKSPKKRPHRPHQGKRGWTRETIYVLKSNVHIPARFPFLETAKAVIENQYDSVFKRRLADVLKE